MIYSGKFMILIYLFVRSSVHYDNKGNKSLFFCVNLDVGVIVMVIILYIVISVQSYLSIVFHLSI